MPVTVLPWHSAQWQSLLRRKHALPHAMLFRGAEGTGKLDFVRKLAQSVACESPAADGAACGACRSCRWFAAGMHPDYRELVPEVMRPDAADKARADGRKPREEVAVEEVRDLADFVNLTAHASGGKTVVFYPAERLNRNAANALLKSLEEPPPGMRFMLVAHRPSRLPPTVVSRCQQIVLPAPQAAAADRWLRENGIANPGLSLAQTGNAPLAALKLSDDDYWPQRKVLLEALGARELDALALAERIRDCPMARLLGWLQRWAYDLSSVKAAGRVRYNPDFEQTLATLAKRLNARDIACFLRELVAEQRNVAHPLNARLYAERLLLSYAALLRGDNGGGDHAR